MPAKKKITQDYPKPARRALGLLLSQLGTYAALSFGRKIAGLGISPPHLGMLRWIRTNGGRISVNSPHLGVWCRAGWLYCSTNSKPRGLVARERSLEDRRSQQLQLTRKASFWKRLNELLRHMTPILARR